VCRATCESSWAVAGSTIELFGLAPDVAKLVETSKGSNAMATDQEAP
jgi:hypothetical protein